MPFLLMPLGQIQARQEFYSIVIQSNWRRVFAQKLLRDLRRTREQMLAQGRKRQAAVILIQSMARVRREMCGNTIAINFQEYSKQARPRDLLSTSVYILDV